MSALRRRKVGGSAGDAAPAETAPEDGDDAPAQRARQPTVMENLERWGYACSVVGRMFSAIWQLLIAMALWVCPLCAREEKRRLRNTTTARALLTEAAALVDKDKYAEALDKSSQALELYEDGGSDGQRANAHALRGLVFATLGKDAEALKDLDAQIKLQPDRPPALVQRASLHFRMDQAELALADFDCAVSILRTASAGGESDTVDGGTVELAAALHQRGLVHAKLDDLYAAVDDVTEAFKLQRDNAVYKQHMGDLAQKLAHYVALNGPQGAENPLTGNAAKLARSILAGSIPTQD